jgi:hypothetical protein
MANAIELGSPIEWCFDMADRLLPTFSFREPVNPYVGPTVSSFAKHRAEFARDVDEFLTGPA